METHWEPLSASCKVLVSGEHRFTTDTILLAHFAAPKKNDRCADLGCGCGTIPLLWRCRYQPGEVFGVEISEAAAEQAERSVEENGFSETVHILRGDIREIRSLLREPVFDLVSCNPPYKAEGAGLTGESGERNRARFEETCTLADAAKAAKDILRYGGRFCICQRPERLTDALCTLREYGLEPKRLRLVQQRRDKAPSLFLLEGRRGGRPGLQVMPALLIENDDGEFSPEMEAIYGDYREGRGLKTTEEKADASEKERS